MLVRYFSRKVLARPLILRLTLGSGLRSCLNPRFATPLGTALLLALLIPVAHLQAQETGRILGRLRIERGDSPDHRVEVTLKSRGLILQSAYADNEGGFGFYSLPNNAYHVVINDDAFQPVDETAVIDAPHETMAILNLTLVRRDKDQKQEDAKFTGGNPDVVGLHHLEDQFPAAAIKQFQRGMDLERKNKRDDAIRAYQKAIEIAPGLYPAHNNLGSALMNKGEYAPAEEQFQEVILLNHDDAAAYFNLGNLYLVTGRLEQARDILLQGLGKEPGTALGHFLLGDLYQKQGRGRDAEVELKRSLELNPAQSKAHLALVNLYLQTQRPSLAIAELGEFLKATPDDPLAPKARELLARLQSSSSHAASAKP